MTNALNCDMDSNVHLTQGYAVTLYASQMFTYFNSACEEVLYVHMAAIFHVFIASGSPPSLRYKLWSRCEVVGALRDWCLGANWAWLIPRYIYLIRDILVIHKQASHRINPWIYSQPEIQGGFHRLVLFEWKYARVLLSDYNYMDCTENMHCRPDTTGLRFLRVMPSVCTIWYTQCTTRRG